MSTSWFLWVLLCHVNNVGLPAIFLCTKLTTQKWMVQVSVMAMDVRHNYLEFLLWVAVAEYACRFFIEFFHSTFCCVRTANDCQWTDHQQIVVDYERSGTRPTLYIYIIWYIIKYIRFIYFLYFCLLSHLRCYKI